MVVSVPWQCKVFLQYGDANIGKLLLASRNQQTLAFTLGAVLCQLCQVELQLAASGSFMSTDLCKGLLAAHVFDELLCHVFEACAVSHASYSCLASLGMSREAHCRSMFTSGAAVPGVRSVVDSRPVSLTPVTCTTILTAPRMLRQHVHAIMLEL